MVALLEARKVQLDHDPEVTLRRAYELARKRAN
jgi:hypothetical protein